MFQSLRGNFSSIIAKTLKGSLPALSQAVSGSENNGILSQIVSNLTTLRANVERSNLVLQLFTMLGGAIGSDDEVAVYPSLVDLHHVDVDPELVEECINFIDETQGYLTFTDSFGLLFNFCKTNTEVTLPDGTTARAVLSSKVQPRNFNEAIILIQNDEIIVNNVVRTANFSDGQYHDATTLQGKLNDICLSEGIDFDGTLANNQSNISEYYAQLTGSSGTLTQMLMSYTTPAVKGGKVRYLWDLVKEYLESSELNSILLSAAEAIAGGTERLGIWITSTSANINSKVQCVRVFFENLVDAYYTGGFKGAISYISNYFRTATSATDEDGLLVFTSNSALVPTQYIVGMIGKLVSTAAAAAGAIISAFQPVIGMAVSLVGGAAYGIFQSIAYDATKTRVGIQTSDRVGMNAAPYATAQGEMRVYAGDGWFEFVNSTPLFNLEVPGGFLLCGPGEYDDDGNITVIRYEFHPSLVNRLSIIQSFSKLVCPVYAEDFHEGDWYGVRYLVEQSGTGYKSCVVSLPETTQSFLDEKYCKDEYISPYVMTNQNDKRLNTQDDVLMKKIIMANLWLFTYWCFTNVYPAGTAMYPDDFDGYNAGKFVRCSRTLAGEQDLIIADGFAAWILSMVPATIDNGSTIFDFRNNYHYCTSWVKLVDKIIKWGATEVVSINGARLVFRRNNFFGEPVSLPSSFDYALVPAEYDSATFLFWIILSAVATVAITVATVAVTMKVKKTIQNKRAEQNAKVESAWDNYKKGEIDYADYRKTVKTANRWQLLVGGTRYDYENYWNGDQSVDSSEVPAGESDQSTLSGIKSFLNNTDEPVLIDGQDSTIENLGMHLMKLIKG